MKNNKMNTSLKASLYYIFGNILGQGIVLIGIVLFSRILSKEEYGIVSTYNATVQIISSFIGLNLFFGLRNAYIDFKNNYYGFRSSVLTLSILIFFIFLLLAIAGVKALGYEENMFYVLCILVHSYSLFAISYYDNSLSMMGKYKFRTLFMIVPNAGHTILSLFLIHYMKHERVVGKIFGNVSFLFVITCIIIIITYKKGKSIINRKYWIYALKISVPSILQSMSNIIIMQCDQVMITYFLNAEETAVYSMIYYVGYILYSIMTATSAAWIPWFYQKMDEINFESISKVQKWYIIAFLIMATGLYMIAPEIVKIIAPKTYWSGTIYAGPFIMSSFIMLLNSFFAYLFLFYKKAYIISAATVITAIVNILLNIIFIPMYGGIAAMYTTVTAYIILLVIYIFWSKKLSYDIFCNKYYIYSLIMVSIGCFVYLGVYRTILIRYTIYGCMLTILFIYCWNHKQDILQISKGRG